MRISTILLCLTISCSAIAQQPVRYDNNFVPPTKAQLEAKRKEYQDAINETERELEQIKKNKNATMSQLKALQYKLAQRQKLIGNINDEMENIDHTIVLSSKEIGTLRQKLETLKMRYAQSLRYSYETRSSYDMMAFLFSSADFNDAVRRMKYLKKFRDFRKQQVDQIYETQNQIQHKIGDLNNEKKEKDQLLASQKQQTQMIQGDMQETNNVIQDLKGKESELMKQAEKNRANAARVNKAIQSIIDREIKAAMRKAEEEAKRRAAQMVTGGVKPGTAPPTPPRDIKPGTGPAVAVAPPTRKPVRNDDVVLALTPTDINLSANFEGNKGKLYWPVIQGVISDHFGVHSHPLAEKVKIINDGIDIRTSKHAPVRAVFEGEVSGISIYADVKTVIIRHGNYFSVYGNLLSTTLTKGQHVNTLQTIGVADDNDEGNPTVKFQRWETSASSSVAVNPELWLGKSR